MTGLLSNQINHLDLSYSFCFDSALHNETIVNILDLVALYSIQQGATHVSEKNIFAYVIQLCETWLLPYQLFFV